MAVKSLKQAIARLEQARKERKALDLEILELMHLVADLGDDPKQKKFRDRDRNIYHDFEAGRGIKNYILVLSEKYNLGPDQVRLIYKQQKELREKKKG